MKVKIKQKIAAVLAATLVGLGVSALPASAHTGAVTGVATCEADGTYSVTWTYQARNVPTGVEAETKAMTTNQGSLAIIDGVNKGGQIFLSVWTEHQINVPGAPVKTGDWSGKFKTVGIPGTFKGDVTTMVQTDWKNGPSEDPVGKVYVDGSCKVPTPEPQLRTREVPDEWGAEIVTCTDRTVTHTRQVWSVKEKSLDGGKTWTEVLGRTLLRTDTEKVRDATEAECPTKQYPPVIVPDVPVPTPQTCSENGSYTLPEGGAAQTGGPGQEHGVVLDGYTLYVQNTTGEFGGPGTYTWQAYGIGSKGNEAYPIGTSVGGKVDGQGNPKAGGVVSGTFIVLHATGNCPIVVDEPDMGASVTAGCGYSNIILTNQPSEQGHKRLTGSAVVYVDGEFYQAVSLEAGDRKTVYIEFPEDSGDHLVEVRTGPAFGDELLASETVSSDCEPNYQLITPTAPYMTCEGDEPFVWLPIFDEFSFANPWSEDGGVTIYVEAYPSEGYRFNEPGEGDTYTLTEDGAAVWVLTTPDCGSTTPPTEPPVDPEVPVEPVKPPVVTDPPVVNQPVTQTVTNTVTKVTPTQDRLATTGGGDEMGLMVLTALGLISLGGIAVVAYRTRKTV